MTKPHTMTIIPAAPGFKIALAYPGQPEGGEANDFTPVIAWAMVAEAPAHSWDQPNITVWPVTPDGVDGGRNTGILTPDGTVIDQCTAHYLNFDQFRVEVTEGKAPPDA